MKIMEIYFVTGVYFAIIIWPYIIVQVFTAALISVLRCVVSMTVNATMPAGDYTDRVSVPLSRQLYRL